MEDRDLIYQCLEDTIPDHMALAGEGYTQRIISDVMSGKGKQFTPAVGGHNLDYIQILELIFSAASVAFSALQYYYSQRQHAAPLTTPGSEQQIV